jgi:hypothetical protein
MCRQEGQSGRRESPHSRQCVSGRGKAENNWEREKIWRQAPRVFRGLGFIDHGRHKEAKTQRRQARDNQIRPDPSSLQV